MSQPTEEAGTASVEDAANKDPVQVTANDTKAKEKGDREEASVVSSPPPVRFIFTHNATRTTWNRQAAEDNNRIQVVVERDGFPNGAIIADRIDPHLLFKIAPALQKRLEGRQIYVPSASCLDEDVIESMVYGLVRCAKEGIPLPEPAEKKPVTMIKMHCVLVFFEMDKEAEHMRSKLWDLFQQVELRPMDVLWIWETFGGRVQSEPYIAPFAAEYVQMMAWQILNLDAQGILNDDIRSLCELEREPKYFTETMEKRFKTHGLGKDPIVPGVPNTEPNMPRQAPAEPPTESANRAGGEQIRQGSATQHQNAAVNMPQNAAIHMPQSPADKSPSKLSSLLSKAPAFESAGFTDVFKPKPPQHPRPVRFGAPDLRPTAATQGHSSMFNYTNASKPIVANPEGAPGASYQNLTNSVGTSKRAKAPGIGSGGARPPKPTAPTTSGSPSTAPAFSGFGKPAQNQNPTATPNAGGFIFGGSVANPFNINQAQQFSELATGPFDGDAMSVISSGPSTRGPTMFDPPASSVPSPGTFVSSSGAPSSNPGMFGISFGTASNAPGGMPWTFGHATPSTLTPGNAGGFNANTNFGGPSQPHNRGPFGDPFGARNNDTAAQNNMFAFQDAPGGAGGTPTGARGGGMVRKIAKATGIKRRR